MLLKYVMNTTHILHTPYLSHTSSLLISLSLCSNTLFLFALSLIFSFPFIVFSSLLVFFVSFFLFLFLSLSLSDAFSLDPDSGLVRSLRLLQSFERFNLTVVATDNGRPPLWGTAILHITVIDVNDNRPVFVRPANGTIMHIQEVCLCVCSWGSNNVHFCELK